MTVLRLPEEDLKFEIARLELKPGDVLAVRPQRPLHSEAAARVRAVVQREVPGIKVLVIDPGTELSVVSKADAKRLAKDTGRVDGA